MDRLNKRMVIVGTAVLVLIMVVIPFVWMYVHGKSYRNKLLHCMNTEAGQFCGIAFPYHIVMPNSLQTAILQHLSDNPNCSTRVHMPGIRDGRTVPTAHLTRHLPSVIEYYHSLALDVSDVIGERVYPTSLHLPTTCAIIIYDQPGDGIEWHYDVNYFRGRFFTVLVPVTTTRTCARFTYRDKNETSRSMKERHRYLRVTWSTIRPPSCVRINTELFCRCSSAQIQG